MTKHNVNSDIADTYSWDICIFWWDICEAIIRLVTSDTFTAYISHKCQAYNNKQCTGISREILQILSQDFIVYHTELESTLHTRHLQINDFLRHTETGKQATESRKKWYYSWKSCRLFVWAVTITKRRPVKYYAKRCVWLLQTKPPSSYPALQSFSAIGRKTTASKNHTKNLPVRFYANYSQDNN